ncbi:hypothetical protein QQS45_12335 [Alteriqipengyuania flavescens]|uniref:hypothetical protein n=1 Tax=Alteriqipengyuania flavescens TaxID=3053610 RepID=UPI0025B54B98|nr:hypothetical protein [Alteriqipengyuania flavescens]WJY18391.1 hypothetical protein QQW98_12330 [Alteriqipengyuania flavescens]WJY24332.1 hypothetical protein QQS45_12335 [Alteriqipengyuania flavescens]
MKEVLEFVLSLMLALVTAAITVGGVILLGCALAAGGCYWGWKRWRRRAGQRLAPKLPGSPDE